MKPLYFLLESSAYEYANSGKFVFINQISEYLNACGGRTRLIELKRRRDLSYIDDDANLLYFKATPETWSALTFRKTYLGPYMRIERSNRRIFWTIRKRTFDPMAVNFERASRFATRWRNALTGNTKQNVRRDFILVPLQGKIVTRRSFQSCSPMEMLEQVAERFRNKNIIVTLHPGERYSAEEILALTSLQFRFRNVDIYNGKSSLDLIQSCDLVATQNSSVAFYGLLFRKPIVLFGEAEFSHIAGNVADDGLDKAISRAISIEKDIFDLYSFWFCTSETIPIGRASTIPKLLNRFRALGWTL